MNSVVSMKMFFGSVFIAILYSTCVGATAKKGIGVGKTLYLCSDTHAFHDVSWWYDWHYVPIEHQSKHCTNDPRGEYVPMLWGEKSVRDSTIHVQHGSKHVLGFNEPNIDSQSHMSPEKAAELWPEIEKKAAGKKLISPAPAGCVDSKRCISWFTKFFAACKHCKVDALAVHAYSCNADQVIASLEAIAKHFHKKIWLTEFSCHSTKNPEHQLRYMKQILPLLEASPHIERYSWFQTRITHNSTFMNTSTDLLERNSSTLTKLGRYYDEYKPPGIVG